MAHAWLPWWKGCMIVGYLIHQCKIQCLSFKFQRISCTGNYDWWIFGMFIRRLNRNGHSACSLQLFILANIHFPLSWMVILMKVLKVNLFICFLDFFFFFLHPNTIPKHTKDHKLSVLLLKVRLIWGYCRIVNVCIVARFCQINYSVYRAIYNQTGKIFHY